MPSGGAVPGARDWWGDNHTIGISSYHRSHAGGGGVSNLEVEPDELLCAADAAVTGFELLEPRDVPLGGPRAMDVRRTLPQRRRSLIGAWCFVDHYGPDDVAITHGMVVPPHPHTGLQTVSWLFAGDIEHRDSVGSHAVVRPGELNLMTAGSGIQHSEVSTPQTTMLHGAQLWVALPDATRHSAPRFEHYAPAPVERGNATLRVFLGSLAGESSPVVTDTELLGAQIDIPAGSTLDLAVDERFEHGILLDAGELSAGASTRDAAVDLHEIPLGHLAYFAPGRSVLRLVAGATPVRVLLIGGVPLGESIVMWWNFIGRTHEEIVEYRSHWQHEVIEGSTTAGRFGVVADYPGSALPAPVLPGVRLRPRG